jgi:hypothetical protein
MIRSKKVGPPPHGDTLELVRGTKRGTDDIRRFHKFDFGCKGKAEEAGAGSTIFRGWVKTHNKMVKKSEKQL